MYFQKNICMPHIHSHTTSKINSESSGVCRRERRDASRVLLGAHMATYIEISRRKVQCVAGLRWVFKEHRAFAAEAEDDNRAPGAPCRDIVGLQWLGRVTHVLVLVKRKPAIIGVIFDHLLREQCPWL